MTNLDGIFKRRDITLPTKVRLVKAMVFPVVIYGCESWTVKKAERRRIDAFELEKTLESPLECKKTGVGCPFFLQCMKVKSESEAAQSCPTLSDPMDCSRPGSSAHGIFQARVLEWGAIAFSIKEP